MASGNTDYSFVINNYTQTIQKKAEEAVKNILPDVNREWCEKVEKKLEEIHIAVVKDFYNSYEPYTYERNYGLFDLLQTELTGESLFAEFDPAAMTHFRSGYGGEDGLYDQVWRKGWHGGAGSGDVTRMTYKGQPVVFSTPHPSPGAPYWREPYQIYTRWGRHAAIAKVPPLKNFQQRLKEYQDDPNGSQADYYQAWENHKKDLVIKL